MDVRAQWRRGRSTRIGCCSNRDAAHGARAPRIVRLVHRKRLREARAARVAVPDANMTRR
ncbi:hypothetical protein BMD20_21810 [Burkholderia multivorans]|nr:hypothetical protein BMD20_21810 [Burkholderia multivorans]KHS18254.1 hypothetical protein BMD22_10010 [Burkholderia multivorans]